MARFLPLLAGAVVFALLFAILGQMALHFMGENSGLHFSLIAGWPVWACAILVSLVLLLQMRRGIAKALVSA